MFTSLFKIFILPVFIAGIISINSFSSQKRSFDEALENNKHLRFNYQKRQHLKAFKNNKHLQKSLNYKISNLPDNVVLVILKHLPLLDSLQASLVCKQWNEIINLEKFSAKFKEEAKKK